MDFRVFLRVKAIRDIHGLIIADGVRQTRGVLTCHFTPPMNDPGMPTLISKDRTGRTRAPMERIYQIHEAVEEGRLPNCSTLARELEVTPKTVQRDITFMRDRLKLPLEYDELAHGYRYTKDIRTFPIFEVGAEELAGLFLARQAIESVRGTQLEQTMREVFAKLTHSMEGKVKFSWADLDKALSRKPGAVIKTDLKLFGKLADAVLECREVEFSYRKLGSDKSEKRRIQPYHLGEVDQCWYLIGYDLSRHGLRTFAFPRIKSSKTHRKTFKVPPTSTARPTSAPPSASGPTPSARTSSKRSASNSAATPRDSSKSAAGTRANRSPRSTPLPAGWRCASKLADSRNSSAGP